MSSTPTPGYKRPAMEAAELNGGDATIKGKVYLVTGAYSGIGVETTRALLAHGGRVIVTGRNQQLLDEFTTKMKEEYSDEQVDGGCVVDLADLASVKAFASYVNDKYSTIDVLICNAGVMNTPPGVTKDGFETQMGVNVIGHFLLAKLLVQKTKRQVWVSSLGHALNNGGPRIDIDYIKEFSMDNTQGYEGWSAYQQSKLGDILIAKEFPKRYKVEAASLHPGAIFTNLNRHSGFFSSLWFMFTVVLPAWWRGEGITMKSAEAGASTSVTVATLPSDQFVNGGYYDDCEIGKESESAKNEEDAKALFDYCDEVTKKFQ